MSHTSDAVGYEPEHFTVHSIIALGVELDILAVLFVDSTDKPVGAEPIGQLKLVQSVRPTLQVKVRRFIWNEPK